MSKNINQRISERTVLDNFTKAKKWSKPINVSDLINAIKDNNNSTTFRDVLGDEADNPGCYKWWAKKEYVEKLLSKILFDDESHKAEFSEAEFNEIFEKNEENFYCIYVGKANNLYDRLKDHSKKTEQSTLRRTICSLTCNKDDSLETINDKIDNCLKNFKIQYFPLFKSERSEYTSGKQTLYKINRTNCSLLDLEYFFINNAFHILNVDVNHFAEYAKKIGKQLDKETISKTRNIIEALSDKKRLWPKEKIKEKKHQ